jgi:Transposase, Mutator family
VRVEVHEDRRTNRHGAVTAVSVAAGEDHIEGLPEQVLEALGELAGAAKEGLLALSVGVGLGVLHELLEAEVDEVVGPKGKHNPDRIAVRHGHDCGEVTLGGRRVPVSRPRARRADGAEEVEPQTYGHFAARDRLTDVMFERMLAGVSTRRYVRTGEPVGGEVDEVARSRSKSAVSREFVSRTRENLIELMSRPLEDLRLARLEASLRRHRRPASEINGLEVQVNATTTRIQQLLDDQERLRRSGEALIFE